MCHQVRVEDGLMKRVLILDAGDGDLTTAKLACSQITVVNQPKPCGHLSGTRHNSESPRIRITDMFYEDFIFRRGFWRMNCPISGNYGWSEIT